MLEEQGPRGQHRVGAAPHLVIPLLGCGALATRNADAQAPSLPHNGERQLQIEQMRHVQGGLRGRGLVPLATSNLSQDRLGPQRS